MEVNSISKGYREYNEDMVIVIKDHFFVVVDAATGIGEPINQPSDGVFLAKELKKEILDLYHSGRLTPKNFVKQMNMISKRIYSRYVKGHKDLERYQFPYASICLAYIDVCDVHIFSIGDSKAFLLFKDGKARFISDQSFPLLDKKLFEEFGSLEKAIPELRKARASFNKGGHRCVYSLYKKPNLKFKHEVYDIRNINELYLCSDGYYLAFDTFKFYKSRRELFSSKHDLQDVYKKIESAVASDPKRIKYPRLKVTDDISAIRVVF